MASLRDQSELFTYSAVALDDSCDSLYDSLVNFLLPQLGGPEIKEEGSVAPDQQFPGYPSYYTR